MIHRPKGHQRMRLDDYATIDTLVFNAITNGITLEYLTTLKQLGKFRGNLSELVASQKSNIEAIITKIEDDTGLVVGSELTYNGRQCKVKSRLIVATDGDTLTVYAKIDGLERWTIEVVSFKLASKVKINEAIGR